MNATSLILLSALFIGQSQALPAANWKADFANDAVYVEGQSVVDLAGWKTVNISSGNKEDAVVEDDNGRKVLLLLGSGAGSTAADKVTTIRNVFEKVKGPLVKIQLALGWEYSGITNQGIGISFGGADYAVPAMIKFTPNEGIVVRGEESVTLLTPEQVRNGQIYEFDLILNYGSRTFDILITGPDVNGSAVRIAHTNLPFQSGVPTKVDGLSAVFLFNRRADLIKLKIESISVTSIEANEMTTLWNQGSH